MRGLYQHLVASTPDAVRVRITPAAFHDIGTPAEYLRTVQVIARAEGRPLDCGAGTTTAPSARIEDSVCWDDADIGDGAEVVGCVVADHVRVPARLRVRDASLVPAAGQVPRPGDRVVDGVLIAPFAPAAG